MYFSKNGGYPREITQEVRRKFRIRLNDGTTRTDLAQITPEQLAEAGITLVNDPPVPGAFEDLGWDGTNWTVTPWTQERIDAYNQQIADEAARQAEEEAVVTDPQVRALLRASPQQIENYIDNNVTNLATAKVIMTATAKAVSILAREILPDETPDVSDGV